METMKNMNLAIRILDSIHDQVLVVDKNHNIRYFNQAFENHILLLTKEILNLTGRPVEEALPRELHLLSELAIECLEEQNLVRGMMELQSGTGISYYRITGIPNFDRNGISECYLMISNHTKMELKKKELKQQLNFLSKLVNRIPSGVFMFDVYEDETSVSLWNPRMKDLFSRTEDEVLGMGLADVFPEELAARFEEAVAAIKNTGLYYDFPALEIKSLQGQRFFHIIINPINGREDIPLNCLCLMDDISLKVRQDRELAELKEKLEVALSRTSSQLEQTDAELASLLKSDYQVSIFSLDLENNYLFFNPHHSAFIQEEYGLSIEKGSPLPFDEDDRHLPGQILAEPIQSAMWGQAVNQRVRFLRNSGKTIYFDGAFSPLYDANNSIRGVTVLFFDITDEILNEEKAESFQLVADNAEYGVLLLDHSFKISYVNPFWMKNLSPGSDVPLGMTLDSLFKDDQLEAIHDSLQQISRGGKVSKLNVNLRDVSGKTVNLLLNFVPYGDIKESKGGIAITCMDITSLEEAKNSLIMARDNAEMASIQKSTFVANMSHEFRTPLNAILGFSSLLKGQVSDEVSRNHVDSIITSSNVLKNLINGVLDFSKIEAGKMEIKESSVVLKSFFKELFQMFKMQYKEKHLDFEIRCTTPVPERLMMDPLRMQQVLINLINNALKFTLYGAVKILISYDEEDKNLIIKIEDSGIGIAKEDQDSVFESFEQREKSDTRSFEGTGIGLTITRKLIELMNGTITLLSDTGAGTRFTFSLPLEKSGEDDSGAFRFHQALTCETGLTCFVASHLISARMKAFGQNHNIRFLPLQEAKADDMAHHMAVLSGLPDPEIWDNKTISLLDPDEFLGINQTGADSFFISRRMPELKRLYVINSILISEQGNLEKKTFDFSVLTPDELAIVKNAIDLKIFNDIEQALPLLRRCDLSSHQITDDIARAVSVFDISALDELIDNLGKIMGREIS